MQITECKDAQRVFDFFEEISKIPRASQNSGKIADYLEKFAKAHGFFCVRDKANNVIVRKPASKGYENAPTVIFQAHTDIVADKISGSDFNFDTDGIEVFQNGDFLCAKGTTLGADDGIGVAYALAILDLTEIMHPEIEAVFTSDEEIGLIGASAIDTSVLRGKILINADSDEEGTFTVGCAGGERLDITLPYEKEDCVDTAIKVRLYGLVGGHSGVEIDKGRENAIKLLAQVLFECGNVKICEISGGSADNAIAHFAECTVFTEDKERLISALEKTKELYQKPEPNISFSIVEESCNAAKAFSWKNSAKILSLIREMPTGVYKMSKEIPDLVETSSNLGIIALSEGRVKITVSLRSSKDAKKAELCRQITRLADTYGATVTVRGEYPAWEYKEASPLRELAKRTYVDKYGKEPNIIIIHAGLECGIFANKIKGLDCISLGPDNKDIHTTEERLSVSSTVRVWEYLKELLKNMNAPVADWR